MAQIFQNCEVDYSQPSILSALFVKRNSNDTSLLINITPKEVDRCIVSCTLITTPRPPSTSSKSEDLLSTVKSDISKSVSYLEKTYRQIAASENWCALLLPQQWPFLGQELTKDM